MLLFVFLALGLCTDVIWSLKEKTKDLHRLTGLSTFYELFNLSENASPQQIRRAFKRLRRSAVPSQISKKDYDNLLSSGLTILENSREHYDMLLKNSKFMYMDEKGNFKNHFFLVLFAAFVGLVFVDGLFYIFRYLQFFERQRLIHQEKKRKEKGAAGKSEASIKEKGMLAPPQMLAYTLLCKLKRRLIK